MSMWGTVAAGLQDNGGAMISDPYSDTSNTTSSYSSLAAQLVGAATNIGESYAVSKVSGGNLVPTGNPLAPTTVLPTIEQAQNAAAVRTITNTPKLIEYGIVGALIVLVGALVLRK